MTIGSAAPATESRAAIKRVCVRHDVNLLLANDIPLFEAIEDLAFYRAVFVGKDVQGVTVAPQVAIWADGVPLTGYSTLDALTAPNEAVEIFSTQSAGVNQAVPVIRVGDVVTLKNSGVAAATVMVADVIIYAAEVGPL
jgi:hypothetical protein